MLYSNNYYVVTFVVVVPKGRYQKGGEVDFKKYIYDIYIFKLLNAENINSTYFPILYLIGIFIYCNRINNYRILELRKNTQPKGGDRSITSPRIHHWLFRNVLI